MGAATRASLLCLLLLAALQLALALVSPQQAQEFVDLHNYIRNRWTQPPAVVGSMQTITWNDTIADMAQTYAEKCNFAHNSARPCCGENIYTITNGSIDIVDKSTWGWASEMQDYDIKSGKCSSSCGHYTQIVSANVTEIGCGVAYCPNLTPQNWPNMLFVVCNYWQPPNLLSGSRPYVTCTTGVNCPTGPPGTSPSPPSSTSTSAKSGSGGLSSGATAGIAVGVIIGVAIIVGIVILVIVLRRRK